MPMASASAMPANEGEGLEDALAHFIVLTTAVLHRDGRAAAHAEAQQDAAGDGAGCQCTLHGVDFSFFTSQQNFIRYSLGVQCFISRKILIK